MPHSIAVLEWAAYAQSLNTKEQWILWGKKPTRAIESLELAPPLADMNPMLRRRVSITGRLACEVAYGATQSCNAAGTWDPNTVLVFATRYGDAHKSLEMLAKLAAGLPVSPTGFGLAVHNAAGAFFSIAQNYKNNMTVVTACGHTIRAAFTESLGLLNDGVPEVVLISYDLPLPEPYHTFHTYDMPAHAWAMRLRKAPKGSANALEIGWQDANSTPPENHIARSNPSLAVLHQWLDVLQNRASADDVSKLWV